MVKHEKLGSRPFPGSFTKGGVMVGKIGFLWVLLLPVVFFVVGCSSVCSVKTYTIEENSARRGIGRVVSLVHDKHIDVNLSYKAFELKVKHDRLSLDRCPMLFQNIA